MEGTQKSGGGETVFRMCCIRKKIEKSKEKKVFQYLLSANSQSLGSPRPQPIPGRTLNLTKEIIFFQYLQYLVKQIELIF